MTTEGTKRWISWPAFCTVSWREFLDSSANFAWVCTSPSPMSGLALRRAFAESDPETPVLFISGNPGTTLIGECFLAKPFTPAELMGKVKELLASRHIPAVAVSGASSDHEHA